MWSNARWICTLLAWISSVLVCEAVATSTPSFIDPEVMTKRIDRLKQEEKIKQAILYHLGLTDPPTSAPTLNKHDQNYITVIHDKKNVSTVTKRVTSVHEIISFSEAPANLTDHNIIQFKFPSGWRERRVVVKRAVLLLRVRNRCRNRTLASRMGKETRKRERRRLGQQPSEVDIKRRKRSKGRRVSLQVSSVGTDGRPSGKLARVWSRIRRHKWFKVSLPLGLIQKMLDSSKDTLLLHVRCRGCTRNTKVVMVTKSRKRKRHLKNHRSSARGTMRRLKLNKTRPFLILHTSLEGKSRGKRSSSHCTNRRRRNRCCKQQMNINFQEMGWNWIVSPREFVTAECVGTCGGSRSGGNSTSCQPVRRKSLPLVYIQEEGVFVRSLVPDIIVTRCGCSIR